MESNLNSNKNSLSLGDENVFVISRGNLQTTQKDAEKLKFMNKLAKAGKTEELLYFTKTNSNSFEYGGIYFRNSFKANSSLFLLGCGFFGPYETDFGNYEVALKVFRDEGKKNFAQEITSVKIKAKDVEKQNIFWIHFPKPVFIPQNEWHQIQFQLDGPLTGRCNPLSILTEIEGVYCQKLIKFDFEFGSRQMPQLKFKLTN